jgi:hypothetical protein
VGITTSRAVLVGLSVPQAHFLLPLVAALLERTALDMQVVPLVGQILVETQLAAAVWAVLVALVSQRLLS